MAERSARPRLAIILAIATLCMRSTMATNFLAYSSWTLGCTGMQDNVPGDCNSGLATLITYVYENVFPELVSRSRLRPGPLLLPQACARAYAAPP